MESLDARVASFAKSRRVKSTSTGRLVTLKWPHPTSFHPNPNTLAEAGFYFSPSSDHRDSVKCFMCDKELSDWERDDNPFTVHLEKARGTCAWALVRCYLGQDGDDFSDPSMLPSSKMMEKARLETFGSEWPHDTVRGHGANSRKMAKAGFSFTPQSSGDDTASCFYCSVALSGWDADDDPLEEHRKRDIKSGQTCRFLSLITPPPATSLAASTSTQVKAKRPPARPPSRTSSRKKVELVEEEEEEDFDPSGAGESSEEEPVAPSRALRNSRSMKSMGSRASTVPSKTPASELQKSTRSGRGKTPVASSSKRSHAAGAKSRTGKDGKDGETEESESEHDAGKKVSRSKSKRTLTKTASKRRIEAIEEEEQSATGTQDELDDVDEHVEEIVEKPKRRGRPPGSGKRQKEKAAVASKTKEKKTPAAPLLVEEPDAEEDSDIEEVPAPKPKLNAKPNRGRTKIDLEESDAISVPSTSKPHTQTKISSMKGKKTHVDFEIVLPPPPNRSGTAKQKGKVKQQPPEEENELSAEEMEVKRKEKVSRSKPKHTQKDVSKGEDDEDAPTAAPPAAKTNGGGRTAHAQPTAVPPRLTDDRSESVQRKSSVTSDDAGYATAADAVHHMDVDVDEDDAHTRESARATGPPARKPAVAPRSHTQANGHSHAPSIAAVPGPPKTSPPILPPSQSRSQKLAESQSQPVVPARPPSRQARAGSSKPVSRVSSQPRARASSRAGHVVEAEIVDISSDDEPMFTTPPPPQRAAASSGREEIKSRSPQIGIADPVKTTKDSTKAPAVVAVIASENNDDLDGPASMQEDLQRTPPAKPSARDRPRPPPVAPESDVEMTDAVTFDDRAASHKIVSEPEPVSDIPMNGCDEHTEFSNATPPPHTPSASPRNTPSPRVDPPPLPSFDEDIAHELHPESFTPLLSLLPVQMISALSEEDSNMTIEEFIRREIELQYAQFKEDGERRIAQFKEQAAETRRTIEAA